MNWEDRRPIEEMTFASLPTAETRQAEPGLNLMVPVVKVDEALAAKVRAIFVTCGVKIAEDIVTLGCTGLAQHGIAVDDAKDVRRGLAGSGVGLTCFVGLDRFCLVHEVIGGLQSGQAQRHAEFVGLISRPLTTQERIKVEMIENARRIEGRTGTARMVATADVLSGRRVPDQFLKEVTEQVGGDVPEVNGSNGVISASVPPTSPPFSVSADPVAAFVCPEHGAIFWSCRFCVAAEIVKGDFVPQFLLGVAADGTTVNVSDLGSVDPAEINDKLETFDKAGANAVGLFVKVARWERKLTRD